MVELILNSDIEKSKIEALIKFLKSWNINAQIKSPNTLNTKKKKEFTLSAGIWKDYRIDANDLRKKSLEP